MRINRTLIYLPILLLYIFTCADVFADDWTQEVETPDYYVQTVQSHFSKEDWQGGKSVLDKALEKYPSDSNLRWLMGRYYVHQEDYDKARYNLVKAVEINYNNVNAKQLLVDVEEATGHYSSAICYVNELLEVNPYWRGLWRRKIVLYRKQGNDVEADRLLKRINQIYPNDTLLRKDYIYSMEQNYLSQKKGGNKKEAIETLTNLIKQVPGNEEYYLSLVNLQLQDGNQEKALEVANNGLSALPGSLNLINKKVGILSDLSRHSEALIFMRNLISKGGRNSGALHTIYNNLVLEAARTQRLNDPYTLYGISYDSNKKNKEALDYLLNISLTRGYNEDALYYIREAKKIYGENDKSLLYKEYLLYSKMGKDEYARPILQKLYSLYPNDYDIIMTLCELRMKEAKELMDKGLYTEAVPLIRFVISRQIDSELTDMAWQRALECDIYLKRYANALSTLDTIMNRNPEYSSFIEKKAFILDKMGKTQEALNLYFNEIENGNEDNRELYIIGYEEIVIPYIKQCLEKGAVGNAYTAACNLLLLDPKNDLGLRYAINTAGFLKKDDEFRKYTEQGLYYYPDEVFYKIKAATIQNINKEHQAAIDILRPELNTYPGSQELVGAFSESSECYALQLSKKKHFEEALAVLDTALVFDNGNKSLKYTKGIVFEQNRQYDSAYYYQKFYEPSLIEQHSYTRHLTGLLNKTLNNEIGLQYLQARYGEEDVITSVATAEYSHTTRNNVFTGRVNYAGRDGGLAGDTISKEQTSGGVGVQLQGEWSHRLSPTWQAMINLAWANKYFPKLTANISVTKSFSHEWDVELHAGYRRIESYIKKFREDNELIADPEEKNTWIFDSWEKSTKNLISAGIGITKSWGIVSLNPKLDLFFLGSKVYYNAILQTRYYPIDDKRTSITAMAGIGSAPETSIIDFAMPSSFSYTNTMVSLGGQFLINPNISLGLTGTWYTYYNQNQRRLGRGDKFLDEVLLRYKNLYNIYAQIFIFF